MNITGKIATFHMDYFGKHEAIATLDNGYKIHMWHEEKDRFSYWDNCDIFKGEERIFSTRIFPGQKREWIHILAGKIKVRFWVNCGDHKELNEMVVPHDVGKLCTIKRM